MFKFGPRRWFIFITSMLLLTDITILFDIPFLRQVFGFLYFTIIPGLLLIHVLKLNKIDIIKKFVLSVGLSISFLILFGLLINNLSLSLGYLTPLSTIPLLISFNIIIIILGIIGCKINKDTVLSLPNFTLSTSEKAVLIIPILLPALSGLGMQIMQTTDNNITLMSMLLLIPVYIFILSYLNHKIPERIYPFIIFMIGLSLLLMLPLRSNKLIGSDVHTEYYFFQTTLNNLYWSVVPGIISPLLNSALSISLLPAIYSSILNTSSTFFFKLLYSLILSVLPLIIYIISRKYIGNFYAFIASFFFMSQRIFIWTAYSPRTNIAILFFALSLMVILDDEIDAIKKKILFITFMVSTIVSHYSTTYIFFFMMLLTWIGMEILSKRYTLKKSISLTSVLLFFILVFVWYSQLTETAFDSGVIFIKQTFINLHNFFILESRSSRVGLVVGQEVAYRQTPFKIEFIFTWLTFVFIGIGVINMIAKYKETVYIPKIKYFKPDFLRTKFEMEYLLLTLAAAGLLIIMIALPYVSRGYDMMRLYSMMSVVLSVIFVLGGIVLSKHLKVRPYLLILLVLIPYFMCVTGTMYEIFDVPRELTLRSQGMQYETFYTPDQKIFAGEWLKNNNVVDVKILNKQIETYSMRESSATVEITNKIYDNGILEIVNGYK